LFARKGPAFGSSLDLDQVAVAREDQVEIDVAVEVLAIVEIGTSLPADETDRDRHDLIGERPFAEQTLLAHLGEGKYKGDPAARDGSRSGRAVGLEDVAIDGDRALADLPPVDRSRWISCERPLGFPFLTSRSERVSVARGSIAYSAVTQPSPDPRRKGAVRSSTLALQSTIVSPAW
jgi:hypothetical protein